MIQPRVLVLRSPGANCDHETEFAFEQAGAQADRVHINRLLESPAKMHDYQILCIPGGFSYGDDIAAGRILGLRINRQLADDLRKFRDGEKLVLGICNGFQVLLNTDLLQARHDNEERIATLAWNDSRHYEDRWVHTLVQGNKSVFLRDVTGMYLPVAHAEGKFMVRDNESLTQLESDGRLVLRYGSADDEHDGQLPYPHNPNGSQGNVAGLSDASGRVLGLMPHPERHIDSLQHPYWTRFAQLPERGDGFAIFRNAVTYFG